MRRRQNRAGACAARKRASTRAARHRPYRDHHGKSRWLEMQLRRASARVVWHRASTRVARHRPYRDHHGKSRWLEMQLRRASARVVWHRASTRVARHRPYRGHHGKPHRWDGNGICLLGEHSRCSASPLPRSSWQIASAGWKCNFAEIPLSIVAIGVHHHHPSHTSVL